MQALEYSHVCKYACSEEVPELQDMGGPVEGTQPFLVTHQSSKLDKMIKGDDDHLNPVSLTEVTEHMPFLCLNIVL